jgi:uncharacterized membrane protein
MPDPRTEALEPAGAPHPNEPPQPPPAVVAQIVAELSHTRTFSGPLPPPDVLKGYEEACKGAAKRILDMAERQAEHRQKMEWYALQQDARRANWGVWTAFLLCLSALVAGAAVIALGHDTPGTVIATAGLASLAGVFIYGTNARNRERTERLDRLLGRGATDQNAPQLAPPS